MNIPADFPRMSEAQAQALYGLGIGWPWGIDGRTARGLVKRGWTRPAVKAGPDGSVWVFQALTSAGRDLAQRLVAANEWEAAKDRREIRETWSTVFPVTKVN